jgi:hypothetical protein
MHGQGVGYTVWMIQSLIIAGLLSPPDVRAEIAEI